MIVIEKEELLHIIKEYVTQVHKQVPISLKLCLDWNKFRYSSVEDVWYFDPKNQWEFVVNYTLFNLYDMPVIKYISFNQIKSMIAKEYPDMEDIEFSVTVKNDDKLRLTTSKEKVLELIDIKTMIHHNDQSELNKDDIKELIDLTLVLGDREWFDELVNNHKEMLN
ncbi:IDEAL domain-containing protein [Paenibacillus spiritus]|uniref:IDEAL domain-containing protein n=1 Tax=Paenibacillus spiritus TaxID=2496557 RepID=A0A5J5GI78_9BACL|nr:IDEAL domain-containing protein [Paenibacillus spiritus]KAA9007214.1 IDEAL domain-containing protein [Paenibacillus spiritus]